MRLFTLATRTWYRIVEIDKQENITGLKFCGDALARTAMKIQDFVRLSATRTAWRQIISAPSIKVT